MDIITYTDAENNPHMLFEDSKPSVIIDIDNANFQVADETVDGKSYITISKENGVSLTLVLTVEGSKQMRAALFNASRVQTGQPQIENYFEIIYEEVRKIERGE